MSESENLLLGLMERDSFALRVFKSFSEFLGLHPEVHDDAEVVKQAREVSFSGVCKSDSAGKVSRDQRASERMFPERHSIDSAVARHHVEHAARHRDVADPLESQPQNCSA